MPAPTARPRLARICSALSFLAATVALLAYVVSSSVLAHDPTGSVARAAASSSAISEQLANEVEASLAAHTDVGLNVIELQSVASEVVATPEFRRLVVRATRQLEARLLTGTDKPVVIDAHDAIVRVANTAHRGDAAVYLLTLRPMQISISPASVPDLSGLRSAASTWWAPAAVAAGVLWTVAYLFSPRRRFLLRQSGKWLISAAVAITLLMLAGPFLLAAAVRPWGEIPAAALRATRGVPLTVAAGCAGLGIPLFIYGKDAGRSRRPARTHR